ncbi:hypothetical protein KKG31_04820 [Patescibacteria group bacterium]|nr:hypothetical protein [Patescibacteria group bacterium]
MEVLMDEQFLQVFWENYLRKKLFLPYMRYLANFGTYTKGNGNDAYIGYLRGLFFGFLMIYIIVFLVIL